MFYPAIGAVEYQENSQLDVDGSQLGPFSNTGISIETKAALDRGMVNLEAL